MKVCACCGVLQLSELFSPAKRNLDGLHSYCHPCMAEKTKQYRLRNVVKIKAVADEKKRQTALRKAARQPGMKEAYAKRKRVRQAEYREKNPEKFAQWVSANRPHYNEQKRLRKHATVQATPAWSDPEICADLYTLAEIYSKFLGEPVHVDHIVPLRSKLVCGLHTPANLSLLIAADNIRKGNRWWPEMP